MMARVLGPDSPVAASTGSGVGAEGREQLEEEEEVLQSIYGEGDFAMQTTADGVHVLSWACCRPST